MPIQVVFSVDGRVQHRAKEEPFGFLLRWDGRSQVCVSVDVSFHAHYGEPPLKQLLNIQRGKSETIQCRLTQLHVESVILLRMNNINHVLVFTGSDGHWKFSLEFAPGSHEWTVHQDTGVDGQIPVPEVEELASKLKHL